MTRLRPLRVPAAPGRAGIPADGHRRRPGPRVLRARRPLPRREPELARRRPRRRRSRDPVVPPHITVEQQGYSIRVLRSTRLSAVVFDAPGNIIGGGNGSVYSPLPPGAREFFKLVSGFRAVPFDQAASVMISLQPSWTQPGG